MWVVKLGGSLCSDASLPQWLELLSQLGGGRIAVVCGGGSLADEVRDLQSRWALDDVSAHNMAVLSMVQNAYLLHGLQPGLRLVMRESDLAVTLRRGGVALWMPLELLRDHADPTTNWDHTSDAIALALAMRLHAERLVVVKSCAIDPLASLDDLVDAQVLDRGFARLGRSAGGLPIDLLQRDQPEQLRQLLLHGYRWSQGSGEALSG